jgi:hypothetical protein
MHGFAAQVQDPPLNSLVTRSQNCRVPWRSELRNGQALPVSVTRELSGRSRTTRTEFGTTIRWFLLSNTGTSQPELRHEISALRMGGFSELLQTREIDHRSQWFRFARTFGSCFPRPSLMVPHCPPIANNSERLRTDLESQFQRLKSATAQQNSA